MTISLIISTYNWPEALRLCLESVMHQTVMPEEILVADDGSREDTRKVVEYFAAISPVPLHHIWHEDNGFRLAAIRNKTIAASSGEYIIQIDGDVILERHFIQDHKLFARKGFFVGGSRALVSEELTTRLLANQHKGNEISAYTRGVLHKNNAVRIPLLTSFFLHYRPEKARGCNMAYWREDLFAINGYEESFTGWGLEDVEFVNRLLRIGRRKRTIKFQGILFHLYHKLASRENHEQNEILLLQSKLEGRIRSHQGIDLYLTIQK